MTKCLRITKMISLGALAIASLSGSAPVSTGAEAGLTEILVSETARSGVFLLVGEVATDIMTDTNDAAVVGIAAHLLAEDVERVTGCKPHVLANPGKGTKRLVVVGSIGKNRFIDALIESGKLDVSQIRGKWESFVITKIDHPFEGVDEALVIAGSNRRGAAYGVFTLSESIGVSPWYWWADVPTPHKEQIYISDKPVVQGPPVAKYVDAVGLQWAGKMAVADLHRRYPDLKKVQTESECGNGSFDWNAAEHTFDLIRHYLSHGVSIYDYWNIVLDETGKSHWGRKQNVLITVNQEDGSVTQTPEYWLFKHFSHVVVPGSVRIPCEGEFLDAMAFRRPDGKLVLVAANMCVYGSQLSVRIGRDFLEARLPARSFNTFILDNPQEKSVSKR